MYFMPPKSACILLTLWQIYMCMCTHTHTHTYGVQCDAQNAEVIQIHLLVGSPHLNSGFLQVIMAI